MPMRLPRLYSPGLSQLLEASFSQTLAQRWADHLDSAEFDRICGWIDEAARREGVRIHAWALTPAVLRMVATPAHRNSLPRLMQAIGRQLGATFRDGPVFKGRYRSSLVEPERWIIPAILWVEASPVAFGFAPAPANWRWSSALTHTGSERGLLTQLSFHHDYWACGNTPFERQAHHKALLDAGLSTDQQTQIERAIHGQWALGSAEFLEGLGPVSSRRVAPTKRGRPRKHPVVETVERDNACANTGKPAK